MQLKTLTMSLQIPYLYILITPRSKNKEMQFNNRQNNFARIFHVYLV